MYGGTQEKMNNKTQRLTIRCNEEFENQLSELCVLYNLNKTQVLERLVNAEWLRTTKKGQAKIKQVQELFNTMTTTMKTIEGQMNVK